MSEIARNDPEGLFGIRNAVALCTGTRPGHEIPDDNTLILKLGAMKGEAATLREEMERLRQELRMRDRDALAERLLRELRADGWTVAARNDYRQHRQQYTYWLLTHPTKGWVRGEDLSDAAALQNIHQELLDRGLMEKIAAEATPKSKTREVLIKHRPIGWGYDAVGVIEGFAGAGPFESYEDAAKDAHRRGFAVSSDSDFFVGSE